jgi:serine/threonine-protein kinase
VLNPEQLDRLRSTLAGRYRIERELGRGAMAVVFLAHDIKHNRDVALKILRPDMTDSMAGERFLQEIRIEASLQHPHILPLYDSGVAEGFLYYVMPHVSGESLREKIARERQLEIDEAVGIVEQVASALEHAHTHSIIHRDIKPGNILLSGSQAYVADFGVARAVAVAGERALTDSGIAVGTPAYMSPEQATAEREIDGRSDVYALGCVLYEMLAGEPPFTGRTVQAVLARHVHEPPPSLRVVRPSVPMPVQRAIERALSKVPADRYRSATQFAEALKQPLAPERPAGRRARAAGVGIAAVAMAALGVWRLTTSEENPPDSNKVVVFPLVEHGMTKRGGGTGEEVAILIGSALEHTEPLRWIDGWTWLEPRVRQSSELLTAPAARRIARSRRARYYIDGAIVTAADSATVTLRLNDTSGDSVVAQASASGPADSTALPFLGLRAVRQLLPTLLEPGRRVGPEALAVLTERRPSAIANWLQGEREYRRSHFDKALDYFRRAIEQDSSLAFAALRGAQAADWLNRHDEAAELVQLVLDQSGKLPERYGDFAAGLQAYITGNADSAVYWFRRTVASDSLWSEAWMALGEVYYHLLPKVRSRDSLARVAFIAARHADPDFTPPLFHLSEIALRTNRPSDADSLVAAFEAHNPDSTLSRQLHIEWQCIRRGSGNVAWKELAGRAPTDVLAAAQILSAGAAEPDCAGAGFRAVLESSHTELHWGALLGLQSLLVATGRLQEVKKLFATREAAALPAPLLYLLDVASGSSLEAEAAAVVRDRGEAYHSMPTPTLWLYCQRAAFRKDTAGLQAIAAELGKRAAQSGLRRDSLLSQVAAARLALVEGHSTEALHRLQALVPSAPLKDLIWQPWEALAGERLALAELRLASGDAEEAYRLASDIDGHRAVVFLIFLPASLELRARAAQAMGRPDVASRHRARLASLRRESRTGLASEPT